MAELYEYDTAEFS